MHRGSREQDNLERWNKCTLEQNRPLLSAGKPSVLTAGRHKWPCRFVKPLCWVISGDCITLIAAVRPGLVSGRRTAEDVNEWHLFWCIYNRSNKITRIKLNTCRLEVCRLKLNLTFICPSHLTRRNFKPRSLQEQHVKHNVIPQSHRDQSQK